MGWGFTEIDFPRLVWVNFLTCKCYFHFIFLSYIRWFIIFCYLIIASWHHSKMNQIHLIQPLRRKYYYELFLFCLVYSHAMTHHCPYQCGMSQQKMYYFAELDFELYLSSSCYLQYYSQLFDSHLLLPFLLSE